MVMHMKWVFASLFVLVPHSSLGCALPCPYIYCIKQLLIFWSKNWQNAVATELKRAAELPLQMIWESVVPKAADKTTFTNNIKFSKWKNSFTSQVFKAKLENLIFTGYWKKKWNSCLRLIFLLQTTLFHFTFLTKEILPFFKGIDRTIRYTIYYLLKELVPNITKVMVEVGSLTLLLLYLLLFYC